MQFILYCVQCWHQFTNSFSMLRFINLLVCTNFDATTSINNPDRRINCSIYNMQCMPFAISLSLSGTWVAQFIGFACVTQRCCIIIISFWDQSPKPTFWWTTFRFSFPFFPFFDYHFLFHRWILMISFYSTKEIYKMKILQFNKVKRISLIFFVCRSKILQVLNVNALAVATAKESLYVHEKANKTLNYRLR